MECDTCGREVDLNVDPLFRKHNLDFYVEHVFLSTENIEDAKRILQEYVNNYSTTRSTP